MINLYQIVTERMKILDLQEVKRFCKNRYKKERLSTLTEHELKDFLDCTKTGKIIEPKIDKKVLNNDHLRWS